MFLIPKRRGSWWEGRWSTYINKQVLPQAPSPTMTSFRRISAISSGWVCVRGGERRCWEGSGGGVEWWCTWREGDGILVGWCWDWEVEVKLQDEASTTHAATGRGGRRVGALAAWIRLQAQGKAGAKRPKTSAGQGSRHSLSLLTT